MLLWIEAGITATMYLHYHVKVILNFNDHLALKIILRKHN